jgi:adenosylcobinamide-phosphate synthase
MAGALGVRLGGQNVYSGRLEVRPFLGDGRRPQTPDIRRAAALSAAVGLGAAGLAAVCAATAPRLWVAVLPSWRVAEDRAAS